MNSSEITEYIKNDIPGDVLTRLSMSTGMSHNAQSLSNYYDSRRDEDGFRISVPSGIKKISSVYKYLQNVCWSTFCDNPQVRTSIIDMMGRVTGNGFGMSSQQPEVQDVLDLISNDPRNRLHTFLPKYFARSEIEGELYLIFTVHEDGFVEIDFRDPGTLGGAYTASGILSLKRKPTMPVVYCFEGGTDMDGITYDREQIPSIFAARYPDLLRDLEKDSPRALNAELLNKNRSNSAAYSPLGGFFRFVVAWDKGFMTTRNVGHLKTVIKWVNLYENLKLYEIDHKKSSGAYLWTVTFEDSKAYALWASMSPEEKRQTGIQQPKAPGGTLLLPPGMSLEVRNPNLPKISDADTDILAMVGSGLNTSISQMMGTENSTFASAKASSGPMNDRAKDSIAWFERFLRYDLWDNVFFLRSAVGATPETFPKKQCTGFTKKKPQFKMVPTMARDFIEFSFPYSETSNMQGLTSAFLGVKHGALQDVMGIPRSELVKRLGFGNYDKLRQLHAVEEEDYPELLDPVDQGVESAPKKPVQE